MSSEWILWAVQEIMAYNFLYDRTLLWFYDTNLSHISLHEASKDNRRLASSIVTECITRKVMSITMISFWYSFLNIAPFDFLPLKVLVCWFLSLVELDVCDKKLYRFIASINVTIFVQSLNQINHKCNEVNKSFVRLRFESWQPFLLPPCLIPSAIVERWMGV